MKFLNVSCKRVLTSFWRLQRYRSCTLSLILNHISFERRRNQQTNTDSAFSGQLPQIFVKALRVQQVSHRQYDCLYKKRGKQAHLMR